MNDTVKLNKTQKRFFEEAGSYFDHPVVKMKDLKQFAEEKGLTVPLTPLKKICTTDKKGYYDLSRVPDFKNEQNEQNEAKNEQNIEVRKNSNINSNSTRVSIKKSKKNYAYIVVDKDMVYKSCFLELGDAYSFIHKKVFHSHPKESLISVSETIKTKSSIVVSDSNSSLHAVIIKQELK